MCIKSLGVAGKRNTDFVSFVTILPIFAAKRPDFLHLLIFMPELTRKKSELTLRIVYHSESKAKNGI